MQDGLSKYRKVKRCQLSPFYSAYSFGSLVYLDGDVFRSNVQSSIVKIRAAWVYIQMYKYMAQGRDHRAKMIYYSWKIARTNQPINTQYFLCKEAALQFKGLGVPSQTSLCFGRYLEISSMLCLTQIFFSSALFWNADG